MDEEEEEEDEEIGTNIESDDELEDLSTLSRQLKEVQFNCSFNELTRRFTSVCIEPDMV